MKRECTTMDHKVLRIPVSDYELLKQVSLFCIIQDPESEFSKQTSLETLLKLSIQDDEDWFEDEEAPEVYQKFYDVNYVRECRLRHVMPQEWKLMYGPRSMTTFQAYNHIDDINKPVKLYCFQRIEHDLKQLRQEYLDPVKYGR